MAGRGGLLALAGAWWAACGPALAPGASLAPSPGPSPQRPGPRWEPAASLQALQTVHLGETGPPTTAPARAPAASAAAPTRTTAVPAPATRDPSAPTPPSEGLGLGEVGALAVAGNPTLRAVRARRGLARAEVIAAGLVPNPVLSVGVDRPAGSNPAGTVVGYGASLAWSVDELARVGPRRRVARLRQREVALDVAWQEWGVAMQAELDAVALGAARAALELHDANVRELARNLARLEHAGGAGAVTWPERVAAQSAYRRAVAARAAAATEERLARATLAARMGLVPQALAGVVIRWPTLAALPHPSLAALRAALPARRLDLRGLQAAMNAAHASGRLASLGAFPPLELSVGWAHDTGGVGAVGLGLSVGLPVADHGQAEAARASGQTRRGCQTLRRASQRGRA